MLLYHLFESQTLAFNFNIKAFVKQELHIFTKMRPTDLKFRSPKERTPAGYYPLVTNNGKCLSVTPKRNRPTMPQARRFP